MESTPAHQASASQGELRSEVDGAMRGLPPSTPILPPGQAQLQEVPQGEAIARLIDHTLLHSHYTAADVERACLEAMQYSFASVVVNPIYVAQAVELLAGSPVLPASVVGFSLGGEFTEIKAAQAEALVKAGVRELDMVLPVGQLLSGALREVAEDMLAVVRICHPEGVLVKVILETGLLDRRAKMAGTMLAQEVGVDYVKTCSGFERGRAETEDIALMRSVVGEAIGVKAAGGIRSLARLRSMLAAGASRIGATQGVSIMAEVKQSQGQDDSPSPEGT